MQKIIRPPLRIPAIISLIIAIAPLAIYILAVTVGANEFDCVPQRFRQPDHTYSATYEIHAPNGKIYHHLDAPGLSSQTMIQTGTVEGCTYRGQPLIQRLTNTPYCYVSRAIETRLDTRK